MTDNILTEKEFPDDNEAVAAPTDEDHEAALQNVALTSDEENEDEGGLRAWLSVAGSFLVYFASFGIVNSFGFFQTYYQLNYLSGYPASEIAFIGTLQITLMYLSGSVAGALFDIYGLKVSPCHLTARNCLPLLSICIHSPLWADPDRFSHSPLPSRIIYGSSLFPNRCFSDLPLLLEYSLLLRSSDNISRADVHWQWV